MNIYFIFDFIHYVTSIISLFSTAILFYLIIWYSPKEMNVYRWMIFYLSATDAVTTIVFLLSHFRVLACIYGSTVLQVNGPLMFRNCGYHFFSALITAFGLNWFGLPLCFTYRFFALSILTDRNKTLFNKKSVYAIGGVMVAIAAGIYCLAFMSGHKKTEQMTFLTNHWVLQYASFAPIVRNRSIDYSQDSIFIYSVDTKMFIIAFYVLCVVLSFVYGYIILMATLIIRNLRRLRSVMSAGTYRANVRLMIALAVQTIMPLVSVIIPALVVIVTVITDTTSTSTLEGVIQFLALGVALNPIVSIVLIKPYRIRLTRWFRWTKIISVEPATETADSQHSRMARSQRTFSFRSKH